MAKVNFYIDGFNFYHKIKTYQEKTNICYKWLNYKSLCSSFLRANQELNKIFFFTAITEHYGAGSNERHKQYIAALESLNIEIIRGFFKNKKEKQTDVNIASYLIEGAFTNQYDIAFLLSGDSDLVPAIIIIKRNFSNNKIIGFVTPPFQPGILPIQGVSHLRKVSDFQKNLYCEDLKNHLLPDQIYDEGKKLITQIPKEYKSNCL